MVEMGTGAKAEDSKTDATVTGEDDPAAGKGAEDKPKTFGQEDVNRIVAAERKKLEAKLVAEASERTKLSEQLKEIKAQLEEKAKNDPNLKTEEGRIEAMQKKHARENDEFAKQLAELKAQATNSEKKRLETLRDRELDEALVAAGCHDLKAGRRYFLPDVSNVDEDGAPVDGWVLKSPSGKLVDIATGVSENLPKYLRAATANVGGAGTMNAGTKPRDKDQIKALEAELIALKQKALEAGTGNSAILIEYDQKKKKLAALKVLAK